MQQYLLYLFVLAFTAIEAQDRNRHIIALECMQQVGIERKIVEDAMATTILPDNEKYKQFLSCSYKKQGYQSENGEILIDNIKQFLLKFYDAKNLVAINNCGNVTGNNHGEYAYNALSCILPKLKQLDRVSNQ